MDFKSLFCIVICGSNKCTTSEVVFCLSAVETFKGSAGSLSLNSFWIAFVSVSQCHMNTGMFYKLGKCITAYSVVLDLIMDTPVLIYVKSS